MRHTVEVDLDDRAFLFPAGKPMVRLIYGAEGRSVDIDASFPFNEARTRTRILTLDIADAKDLARRLIDAVYQARTQHVISDSARIAINVLTNGYQLQIGDLNHATDIFLGTGSIWRVIQGLLRAVDHIAPIEAN
jgi:regulator of extracellular matrix RemA (YlzA/DUF370 family)